MPKDRILALYERRFQHKTGNRAASFDLFFGMQNNINTDMSRAQIHRYSKAGLSICFASIKPRDSFCAEWVAT